MASNKPRPTQAERRSAARAQAQALRAEQARKERRAMLTRRGLIGGGVLVAAGVGTGLVLASRDDGAPSASGSGTGGEWTLDTTKANATGVPSVALADGSWTYGEGLEPGTVNSAPAGLEVYFDYSCHFCAAFETLHADEIAQLVTSRAITLVLHPCKILGMAWTDMVMNAMAVTLENEPAAVLEFHKAISALFTQIYDSQDTSMMTVDNIVSTAQDSGVSSATTDKFAAAVDANTYSAWTELGTQTFSDKGFTGTPTVQLNGETVDLSTIGTATGLTDLLRSKSLLS